LSGRIFQIAAQAAQSQTGRRIAPFEISLIEFV
jgi:hypothetical protein